MTQRMRAFLAMVTIAVAMSIVGNGAAHAVPNLPPGRYFIHCDGNVCRVYNLIGKEVAVLGMCIDVWAVIWDISGRAVAPPPASISPADHANWQGLNAEQWVSYVRTAIPVVAENPTIDVAQFLNADLPTFTCNEAHLDPPVIVE